MLYVRNKSDTHARTHTHTHNTHTQFTHTHTYIHTIHEIITNTYSTRKNCQTQVSAVVSRRPSGREGGSSAPRSPIELGGDSDYSGGSDRSSSDGNHSNRKSRKIDDSSSRQTGPVSAVEATARSMGMAAETVMCPGNAREVRT